MRNFKNILSIFISAICVISCGIETDDKDEIYYLWTNAELPKDVLTINGKYWESGHFTKEYEVYIHLKPTVKWWNEFKKVNELDSAKSNFSEDIILKLKPNYNRAINLPEWFKPNKNSTFYQKKDSEFYWNEKTKDLFIHEIQL
ncbi:hypothetical protein ASG31_06895 [Chryseobacterium sp. Leaf404]|uniref:hypothetical protein n=1 Tax=unclassified Chryseobacterium TaxID=2593645 RepID=UPI0006FED687|nr:MULTISPECIES: hypothetical protein [unclassified Chryseobacterium]KQT18442.1 hypothetical protein ASG31_06895 [Chryseobacterium sp. Leaf404]